MSTRRKSKKFAVVKKNYLVDGIVEPEALILNGKHIDDLSCHCMSLRSVADKINAAVESWMKSVGK